MFPLLEPLSSGQLDVGDGHRLYFESCGNPHGVPVVVLHGGPGSGASPRMRTLYDPQLFHVVLFDQRGAGRSLPAGELHANHLDALLADIERLRVHFGIARWLVSGGSWGATLALAYAASYPQAVLGVLVRSIFLSGERDLHWFFQGVARLVPQDWEALAALVSPAERDDLLAALQRRLNGTDPALARTVALAWARYEERLARPGLPGPSDPALDDLATQDRLLSKCRLQAHYLRQQCFLGEARLWHLVARLPAVPVAIVHGRLDWICVPENAWRLHQAIPGSRLTWADGAGHEPFHPAMANAWNDYLHCFAERGDFATIAPAATK